VLPSSGRGDGEDGPDPPAGGRGHADRAVTLVGSRAPRATSRSARRSSS
jgi:hypothetical protein